MKKKLIIITSILILIATSISIAYFSGTIENIGGSLSVNSGKVTFTISETRVNANNLVPIYNTDYEDQAYKHTFTITRDSDSTLDACYELNLVIDSIGTNLRNSYLHYRLEYDEVSTEGTFNGKTNGDTITLITNQTSNSTNTTKTYTLYIWLEYSDSIDQTSILTGDASSRTLTSHLEISGGIDSCISEEIPVTAYKYNNQDTDISYSTLYNALGTEYEASVSCTNGSVYTYSNGSITLDTLVVPDRCTINFTDKEYQIDITCNNCTSSPSTDSVLYNESPTFNITPDSAYTLEGATVNCSNSQSASINESTGVVTVSNVTNSTTCTISPVLNQFTVTGSAVGSGTVTSSTSIIYGSTTELTVTPNSGYYLASGSCDNDYTITDMNTGTSYQSEQTVTINNNNQIGDSTCTFSFLPATYTGEVKYLCSRDGNYYDTQSAATSACAYSDPYTGATYYYCNATGTTYTTSSTASCTSSSTSTLTTAYYYCSATGTAYTTSSTASCTTSSTSTLTTVYHYCSPQSSYTTASTCSGTSATRTLTRTRVCNRTCSACSWGEYLNGVCYESIVQLLAPYCTSTTSCRACATKYGYDYYAHTGSVSSCCNLYQTPRSDWCLYSGSYASSVSDDYGTAGSCASGYTIGSFSGTCTPSGSSGGTCSSDATCSTTQTASCTASTTGTYYYCNGSYQTSSSCTTTSNVSRTGPYYYCNGSYQSGTSCTTTTNVARSTRYYCSTTGTYQTSSSCARTSYGSTSTKYYCSSSDTYQDSSTCYY